jgi:hypothetical protein
MEGKIRVDIMAEMNLTMAQDELEAVMGTSTMVQREVVLATHQLSSHFQVVRREHSVAVVSLAAEVATLGSLSGFPGGAHLCCSLNADFPADWDLILDFMGCHTSPESGRVCYNIEDCVAPSSSGPSLPRGQWAQVGTLDQAPPYLASAKVLNLQKKIADLLDRISSKHVSIDSFIFLSLLKMVDLCIQHLSGDVGQALICLDAPSLIHCIGREFSSNQDTRESLYQNKKADISYVALTLHSSVSTVLLEILGNSNIVGVKDTGLLMPCAKTYKYWSCSENGVSA